MTCTPNRRWFRFSLRTLFVVVTIVIVLAGWHINQYRLVGERTAAARQAGEYTAAHHYHLITLWPGSFEIRKPSGVSWLRTWLGDQAEDAIELDERLPPEIRARMAAAFPEATIKFAPTSATSNP